MTAISNGKNIERLEHVMLKFGNDSDIPFYFRETGSDRSVFRQIFIHKQYQLSGLFRYDDILAEYQRIITSGQVPLIIDCGANIGASTLWFSNLFPEAKVFAVEPEINNYEILCTNCSFRYPCIVSENLAVSCKDEMLYLHDPGRGSWGFRTGTELSQNGIAVRAVSIESVEKMFPETNLFTVKIDIEGGESRLFESNVDWIDRAMVIIIELHDRFSPRGANSQNCLQALSARRRDFMHLGENIISVRND